MDAHRTDHTTHQLHLSSPPIPYPYTNTYPNPRTHANPVTNIVSPSS